MKQLAYLIGGLIMLTGCGKSGGGKGDTPVPQPGKLALLAPAQNELCTQGSVISTTQSTVTLKWAAFNGASTYELAIKNLEDGTVKSQTTSSTQADATLDRNQPYSWSVISRSASNAVLAKSDTWRFYNAGPSIVDYAPFPAEIISPSINQVITVNNGKVNLKWNATDVDNDILNYDIYLGESQPPALVQTGITTTTVDINVVAGKTYYWKIVTRDAKGNTSDSGVYQFMTE